MTGRMMARVDRRGHRVGRGGWDSVGVMPSGGAGGAHMLKQPWHLTSMKNELGDCTSRLSLCFCFSSSTGGCSRSMSLARTCGGRGKGEGRGHGTVSRVRAAGGGVLRAVAAKTTKRI